MKRLIISAACVSLLAACGKEKSKKPPIINNQAQQLENPKGVITEGSGWDWFTRDPEVDGIEGLSSNRAIEELNLAAKKQIIVAVIDSGIDVHHEDLRNVMWRNPKEILNGKDDDGNGYVDDIYGWNFLGGPDGRHIDAETLEVTREVKRYRDKVAAGEDIPAEKKAYYEAAEKYVAKSLKEAKEVVDKLEPVAGKIKPAMNTFRTSIGKAWGLKDFTAANLEAASPKTPEGKEAKATLLAIAKEFRSISRFFSVLKYNQNSASHYYNVAMVDKARADIVGDEPDNFEDTQYGNNDVTGPDPSHGTHVAGMIAAERNNALGIDGIADNVRIMALRAVPNGDERDKDIAMAVRYAIKNKANIINMSFGKSHSPNKPELDAAFRDAAAAGILIVHAAGNSSKNLDKDTTYPNPKILGADGKPTGQKIGNWLTIGASAQLKNENMVAIFSNYGKNSVDIFAPGVATLSSTPGDNYAAYSGTSMACPATAGAAALIWSRMGDELSASDLRQALLDNARLYPDLKVAKPTEGEEKTLVPFSELSITGGVVDALATLKALTSQ